MPDRRYSILFYAAVVTAIGATYGVYRILRQIQTNGQVTMRTVVVAAKDLPEGTSLNMSALATRQFPVAAVPAGAFERTDSLIGRIVGVPVFSGEAIVPGRLAPMGTGPGLEVKITPGQRAMAVKIDDVAGISGLIQPNSRVDVVVTLRPTESAKLPIAKLFMENLRVLSVGTTVQRDVDGKPINATTAALEVTPTQAEQLAIATHEGSIQLVLRGYGDPQTVTTRGAYARDVLGASAPPLPATPTPAPAPRPAPKPVRHTSPPPPPPVVPVAAPTPPPAETPMTIYRAGKVDVVSLKDSARVRRPSN